MLKVKIENNILSACKGENLRAFLVENGFYINSPCGGNGTCGKCIVYVNGEKVKSCDYTIASDITVTIPESEEVFSKAKLTESTDITDNYEDFVLCLDIGTTTVSMAKASKKDGRILNVITKLNSQIVFGADIISRIDYCKKYSVAPLKDKLIEQLNNMSDELNVTSSVPLFVSANTTMLHFLFGEDASSLGTYPYTPVFLDEKTVSGEILGLKNITTVHSLPCISSFVGADLVAGLNFIEQPTESKYNILVDLGTNAEILLFSKDKLFCTSAAAGPCFEGGNISCGMGATDGAVYSFGFNKEKEFVFKTIGNTSPSGICGTGLIDIISELIKEGYIDETGYIESETIKISENIFLSQKDIRQYQLAKSAVCSAIIILMKLANVSFDDIESLYISGGFADSINIENAVSTGLLPEKLKEKTIALNNTSLGGTIKFSLNPENPLNQFKNTEYVDLSLNPDFSELFIKNTEFLSGDDYD